jgi:hypothetical protein
LHKTSTVFYKKQTIKIITIIKHENKNSIRRKESFQSDKTKLKKQFVNFFIERVHFAQSVRMFRLQKLKELLGEQRVARLARVKAVDRLDQISQRVTGFLIICSRFNYGSDAALEL